MDLSDHLIDSKSPVSAYAAARVSAKPALSFAVNSHTLVARSTDCLPLRTSARHVASVADSLDFTTDLEADERGNGVVDAADFTVWRDHVSASP
jgi:hypothetical protein